MISNTSKDLKISPLLTMEFPILYAKRISDTESFNLDITEPQQCSKISEKLRWYRYLKGLLQREVADYLGIDRNTYSSYEESGRDYYPPEQMKKLAEFYSIPLEQLLDEYNLFLYRGQAQQIIAMRDKLQMTQEEFAAHIGTSLANVKKWEQSRVRMTKSSWEKYFKDRK